MATINGADVSADAEPPRKIQKAGDEDCTTASGKDEKQTEFTFSEKPTLEDIRKLQAVFASERNWDKYHTPRNLLLAMVGEVGELSEVFQWRGEVAPGLPDWSEEDKAHLGQELSDVLIYLIRLADKCHINLPEVALQKMEMNRKKYPAKKVFGSSKKYNEYD